MKSLLSAKILPVAALASLLSAPMTSQADQALDACIDAFVKSALPDGQPVKVRKSRDQRSPLDAYATTRQVQIVATVSRTGARVAQATCTVDNSGRVVALNGAPPKSRIVAALQRTAAR